jgi:hypothetical protein
VSLISAKCPHCGGALEIENGKETIVCPYCNTSFITEKAIDHYSTTIINPIYQIINNISNLKKESLNAEMLLNKIKAFLIRENKDAAIETLNILENKYPNDYRVDEGYLVLALNDEEQGIDRGFEIVKFFDVLKEKNYEVFMEYYRIFVEDFWRRYVDFLTNGRIKEAYRLLKTPKACMIWHTEEKEKYKKTFFGLKYCGDPDACEVSLLKEYSLEKIKVGK